MKKYLGVLILFLTLSAQAQKLSDQFKVKDYAKQQTEMIQSALDLDQATTDQVYQANLSKAYAIHKRILLLEYNKKINGQNLDQVIKEVKDVVERDSGYLESMEKILGEEKFTAYKEKFQ